MRPRMLMQNQRTRELISTWITYKVQQQRPDLPAVTLTSPACKYKVQKLHQRYTLLFCGTEDVPLVEFMYLVFTRRPGECYHRQLGSLLLCYVFWVLTNSLVCWLRCNQLWQWSEEGCHKPVPGVWGDPQNPPSSNLAVCAALKWCPQSQ